MKNKQASRKERLFESSFYNRAPKPVRWIIGSLSNNLGYKLLSLVLAILLWSYVISTNTSITRTKTISSLTADLTGQSALTDHKLALTEDPSELLTGVSVVVEAPMANYANLSASDVQVTLDLSNVRSAGAQKVALRATTTSGRVRSITPESVTLSFEALDSRNVSVNPVIRNQAEGYWYNISRSNPLMLTVSGAASVVQNIASARVNVDVKGIKNSVTTALPYQLLDTQGTVVSQTMLNCSTSSVSVSLDIYPCREIPITKDMASLVTGQPAEGYELQSVTIQPETVQVAAEQDLLDSLTELMIEPVSIEGANQSFSAKSSVSQLSDIKNVSTAEVYVNVNIDEASINTYVTNVTVLFRGKADNLVATYEPVGVFVGGKRSVVEALQQTGITLFVDLTGCGPGYYLLDPSFDEELYADLVFQCEAVSVTLTDISQDSGEADE